MTTQVFVVFKVYYGLLWKSRNFFGKMLGVLLWPVALLIALVWMIAQGMCELTRKTEAK